MNNDQKNILGKISDFFIDRYRVTYLIIAAIILLGVQAYYVLPREIRPEIVFPYGIVTVTNSGAAPQEMETLITDKIETKLKEIDDIKSIRSSSSNGISTVNIEFQLGSDIDKKVNEMRNKISEIKNELPDESNEPIVAGFETSDEAIMTLNISGNYDAISLKNISENIQDELEKVDGVSEVTMVGDLEREISIYVDSSRLASYNISMDQIKNAIASSNINTPGGNIELDGMNFNVRTVGEFNEIKDIENTIISVQDGMPIYLKNIASVEDTYKDETSYSQVYEKGISKGKEVTPSITLSVTREDNSDTIAISNEIKELLKSSKGKLYPQDVFISITGDTGVTVNDEINNVVGNTISGLVIVIIVLFLFIGFRESIIVAFVIPLSLLCSFVLMKYSGMTFNSLSLLALILALGMLVDNAIVIMENIDGFREKGLDIINSSKIGTNQVAPAVFASTLTTMAAFLPMSTASGMMGEFLKTIPITVMFAIGSSFLISLIITPALCSRFLDNHKVKINKNKEKFEKKRKILSVVLVFVLSLYAFMVDGKFGLLSWFCAIIFSVAMYIKQFKFNKNSGSHSDLKIIGAYTNMMDKILKSKAKRAVVAFTATALFCISLLTIPLGILKIELIPTTDSKSLSVNIQTPSGYLLEDTRNVVGEVEKILFDYPEIENFVSKIENTGKISIDLVDENKRKRSSMQIIDSIREDVKKIAGAKITVEQAASGPSSGKPISIEIKGEDLDSLSSIADHIQKIMNEIPGTAEVSTSIEDKPPELQIIIDKEKANLLGLNVNNISSEIRKSIQGVEISKLREKQDEVDIVIRTNDEEINSINDFEKIYFTASNGEKIKFSQVASLVETKGLNSIAHEDLKRIIKVESNVAKGANSNEIIKVFKAKIKSYSMPDDVEVSFGGESEDIVESFTDMFKDMIFAILLVFIILAIQLNSLSQPMVILSSLPLAVTGALVGLIVTNNNFGLYAFMGIVSLVGIAVNDAIVLVDYTNYLRKNGYELLDAVKEAGKSRFLPVMATSITTIGGILPLALKEPGYAQMGFVLIFGLGVCTVLTLVIIPISYFSMEKMKTSIKNRVPIFVDKVKLNSDVVSQTDEF